LTTLVVDGDRAAELQAASREWPSWDLTPRQLCDLELLLNGAFSPLQGFMGRAAHESVCASLRLPDGLLWPIPVTLDIPEELAKKIGPGSLLALRDPEGVMLAALHVEEVWQPDREAEAEAVYGTTNLEHPGVAYSLQTSHPWYAGGRLEGLRLPVHYDFRALRLTPKELREEFARLGWRQVVAFQTRNPMHRAHQELTLRAAKELEANLLIHPVVGMTKPGDVDHYTRVRCYQALLPHYPRDTVKLSLLPLAMRLAGPREAVWHAIIRKNYGCTHLIVGRDHAGPGKDSAGKDFYDPYAAQDLLRNHEEELGVGMVPFKMMVYVEDKDAYMPEDEVSQGARVLNISGTELRRRLADGREIPSWFSFPEVARELRRTHPPRYGQGFTVFFTGLSGSGKSTIANVLLVKFLEVGGRPVTLLDTKNGGIALCAPIAPYDSVRNDVRRMIEPVGGFVLVHVATPLEVCEQRDRKGLYAKARAGVVQQFTGISDPYEAPAGAEVVLDTSDMTPEEAAQVIILHLEREGYVGPVAGAG
jgi:sulfate adenylyltransferase